MQKKANGNDTLQRINQLYAQESMITEDWTNEQISRTQDLMQHLQKTNPEDYHLFKKSTVVLSADAQTLFR